MLKVIQLKINSLRSLGDELVQQGNKLWTLGGGPPDRVKIITRIIRQTGQAHPVGGHDVDIMIVAVRPALKSQPDTIF